MRKRLNIIRMLSLSVSRAKAVKRLNRRPVTAGSGRTSACIAITFVDQIVVSEELRENLRMTQDSLYS